jgi:hypothetical protein
MHVPGERRFVEPVAVLDRNGIRGSVDIFAVFGYVKPVSILEGRIIISTMLELARSGNAYVIDDDDE